MRLKFFFKNNLNQLERNKTYIKFDVL